MASINLSELHIIAGIGELTEATAPNWLLPIFVDTSGNYLIADSEPQSDGTLFVEVLTEKNIEGYRTEQLCHDLDRPLPAKVGHVLWGDKTAERTILRYNMWSEHVPWLAEVAERSFQEAVDLLQRHKDERFLSEALWLQQFEHLCLRSWRANQPSILPWVLLWFGYHCVGDDELEEIVASRLREIIPADIYPFFSREEMSESLQDSVFFYASQKGDITANVIGCPQETMNAGWHKTWVRVQKRLFDLLRDLVESAQGWLLAARFLFTRALLFQYIQNPDTLGQVLRFIANGNSPQFHPSDLGTEFLLWSLTDLIKLDSHEEIDRAVCLSAQALGSGAADLRELENARQYMESLGRDNATLAIVEAILRLRPTSILDLARRAELLDRIGQFKKAAEVAEYATKQTPWRLDIIDMREVRGNLHRIVGRVAMAHGDIQKAEKEIEEAINHLSIARNSTATARARARIAERLGQATLLHSILTDAPEESRQAETLFTEALQGPNPPAQLYAQLVAAIYAHSGPIPAKTRLEGVFAVNPTLRDRLKLIYSNLSEGRFPSTGALPIGDIVRETPSQELLIQELCSTLRKASTVSAFYFQQVADELKGHLENFDPADRDFAFAAPPLIRYFLLTGELREAAQWLSKLEQNKATGTIKRCLALRAQLQFAQSEDGKAHELLNKLEHHSDSTNNDKALVYFLRGESLTRRGVANNNTNLLSQADKIYQDCLNIQPNKIEAADRLAMSAMRRGDFSKAQSWYNYILDKRPSDSRAQTGLALIFARQEDTAKAAEQLISLLEKPDVDPWSIRTFCCLLAWHPTSKEFQNIIRELVENNQVYTINRILYRLQRRALWLDWLVELLEGSKLNSRSNVWNNYCDLTRGNLSRINDNPVTAWATGASKQSKKLDLNGINGTIRQGWNDMQALESDEHADIFRQVFDQRVPAYFRWPGAKNDNFLPGAYLGYPELFRMALETMANRKPRPGQAVGWTFSTRVGPKQRWARYVFTAMHDWQWLQIEEGERVQIVITPPGTVLIDDEDAEQAVDTMPSAL